MSWCVVTIVDIMATQRTFTSSVWPVLASRYLVIWPKPSMLRSSITGSELVQLLLVLCRDDPCELQHGGSLVEALQCRYLLCKQNKIQIKIVWRCFTERQGLTPNNRPPNLSGSFKYRLLYFGMSQFPSLIVLARVYRWWCIVIIMSGPTFNGVQQHC